MRCLRFSSIKGRNVLLKQEKKNDILTTKENFATAVVKVGVGVVFCIGKIGLLIPCTRNKINQIMLQLSMANTVEDFNDFLFRKKMYQILVKQIVMDIVKTVKLNKPIQNYSLLKFVEKPKENEEVLMVSVQRKGVPLILNFGSCS